MTELRDYQQDLLDQVSYDLQDNQGETRPRLMLQLPTGGGKTHIAAALLQDWLQDGRKAVWLTHRRELASQTAEMLSDSGVSAICNIRWTPGDKAPFITNGVVILMAQTVSRRTGRTARTDVWQHYNRNDLLIVDEAHHATARGWARAIWKWPGPVLGMTATPWRLSMREGFDCLFNDLYCGPQVAELQAEKWLCKAWVLSPPESDLIQGGVLNSLGEYSKAGIEAANQDRDILTAGVLKFWQRYGEGRQSVIYAVSVQHAENLAALFNEAGLTAGVLVNGTPGPERDKLINGFKQGRVTALINVTVATEGFDLPDAACVVLCRPTMSLSLYLQMVGRGLRPKPDDGNCLIIDLAGNSRRHGLPEENRNWSLKPRGPLLAEGNMPLTQCPHCATLSPAASHHCQYCSEPFGRDCGRCGAWRARSSWSLENVCGPAHDPVCDRCHYDAHIQANLPVFAELKELTDIDQPEFQDIDLHPDRDHFLRNMLLEELRRVGGSAIERREDLSFFIEVRELELADENELERLFNEYLNEIPQSEQPKNRIQENRRYYQWEEGLKKELSDWRDELASLENLEVDGDQVYHTVREYLLHTLEAEARELELIKAATPGNTGSYQHGRSQSGQWMDFVQLTQWGEKSRKSRERTTFKPVLFQDPQGREVPIRSWAHLLAETIEWLIRAGIPPEGLSAFNTGRMHRRYLLHDEPPHPNGREFKSARQLSNGLYVELQWSSNQIPRLCPLLVEKFDYSPAQFHVLLR